MSLDENIVSVVQAIGAEIKEVRAEIAQGNRGSGVQNVFIQEAEPVVAQGNSALWIDTSSGDVTFNLVIGE